MPRAAGDVSTLLIFGGFAAGSAQTAMFDCYDFAPYPRAVIELPRFARASTAAMTPMRYRRAAHAISLLPLRQRRTAEDGQRLKID